MSYVSKGLNRRIFLLKNASLASLAGTPFAMNMLMAGAASAQSVQDYKALVCVFLAGGNDQTNTVVPRSGLEYLNYQSGRPTLAIPSQNLLAITPTNYNGPALGLHPSMTGLHGLFNEQRVAILANVGTLAYPITKAQWNAGRSTVAVPIQLFSHSDQQGAWQTGLPDRPSQTGWQGRVGDLLASTYNRGSGVSIAMSIAGNNIMQAGVNTIQYQLTTNGAVRVNGPIPYSELGINAQRMLITQQRQHLLENELNKISSRAINTESIVSGALSSVNVSTAFPETGIGRQLRMVARMIAARGQLSQGRQMFFVQHGGYDFHDNLLTDQATKLQELSDAMTAFYRATESLGVAPHVTTFTASDFGRAQQHNGRGSDHGWGAHHFIVGGAVMGNRVFGQFPSVVLNGPDDSGRGSLIPTTSVDEYVATLSRWFGVSLSNLPLVLPNIGRFNSRDLGFMGVI